jgi:hypothetical protein
MRNCVRSVGFVASVFALPWLVLGCEDECKRGANECVSTSLIRTCVPGDNGNAWLISQCSANERCDKNALEGSDAGADKSASDAEKTGGLAACVGTCEVGDHECVSDALARYCVNGGVWQLDACQVGEKCELGECKLGLGSGSVQSCVPGAKACASEKVEKVCDSDGTAWVESACSANEVCTKNECVPDPKSSCDDSSACFDNKTAIRCLGQADGFKLVKCQGDLYCETGRCRGAVCAVGSVCTGSNQVRECVDGTGYKDIQCGSNEVCQQDKDDARCVPLQCVPGTSACGDPRDPSLDAKKHFSACVTGAGSGIPEWVHGECSGLTTCNPALAATSNPCAQTCTKGAQRCATDPLASINDGIQTCDDEGKWGSIKSCNVGNESRLQCVLPPNLDPKKLPAPICATPVCAWATTNPSVGATGACDGDKLRKCQPDGTLGEAAACDKGICRTLRSTTTADGRMPGACDVTPECQEGETLCASSNGAVTPRYRTCQNGFWSTELKTCADDGACYNSRNDKGLRHTLCGVACSPTSRRCNSSAQLEECAADGSWNAAQKCAAGSCRVIGNNEAACVLDCVPGAKVCTGSSLSAPDGYHLGTTQEVVCGADGLRGTPKACDTGKTCRVTDSGVSLGCVACVGTSAPGGNDEGTADSRCDPQDAKKVQECGADNSWQAGRSCSGSKTCKSPSSGTCASCSGSHSSFVCTQTNIVNEPICGGCSITVSAGSTSLAVCSESAIAATSGATSGTCSGQGRGTAGSWGGVADCCSTAHTTAGVQLGASCINLGYGSPSAWSTLPDCCGSYQLGPGGAASFAYCE